MKTGLARGAFRAKSVVCVLLETASVIPYPARVVESFASAIQFPACA